MVGKEQSEKVPPTTALRGGFCAIPPVLEDPIMTKKQILVSSLALFSTSMAFAAGANEYTSGAQISFTALSTTSGGVFEGMPDAHTAAYYADNTNVTHMIIEGMQAPEGTTGIIGGDFILVNAATGETHGEGVIVFETGIGSGSTGSSAIVGVIPLAGGLANAAITRQTAESPLGGRSAPLTYSPTAGAMKFDTGSGESVINYLCTYEGELEMEAPFWIDTVEGDVKFSEGFLEVLENDSIGGVILTDVMGDTVAESIFLVTVSDENDSDSDGVADLLDADSYWYCGSNYDSESGWLNSPWFGQYGFVYSPRNDDAWNGFVAENHCFFWHEQHGYL